MTPTTKLSTLAEALAAAQADMPAVEPNAVNPHFRSKFVSLDYLIAKTRPVLNLHGLSLTQWPSTSDIGQPTLTTRLTHVSGEAIENTMPLLLGKQDMQGLGAAITYARRYAWSAALGIAADEDDDGNQASTTNGAAAAATNGHSATTAQAMQAATNAARNGTISEPQQKRLIAIAKQKGVAAETVKQLIGTVAGVATSAEVPKAKYDELVAAVEAAATPLVPAGTLPRNTPPDDIPF
jgi:hypothetical protein